MAGISEGEAAVYDRQLRLWGVQAQQRLLKSKVLVWGLEGSNIEVCKNLVLAGVSLVVRDHRPVEDTDVAFNYFLREEDVGQNRAECASRRIQEMNPLATVTASSTGLGAAKDLAEDLRGYSMVVVALGVLGWDVEHAIAVDAACRDNQAGFVLSLAAGEVAFFFSDQGEHIVRERSSAQGGAGSTAQTASTEEEKISFPSLADFVACTPAELAREKVDPTFLLLALFLAFLRQTGGREDPNAGDKFLDYCSSEAKCAPKVDGVEDLKHAYTCFFVEPLIHVASVLGGLLAQEVIKAITARDPPLVNCVCFTAHGSTAFVERIPSRRAAAPLKRKAEECLDIDD